VARDVEERLEVREAREEVENLVVNALAQVGKLQRATRRKRI